MYFLKMLALIITVLNVPTNTTNQQVKFNAEVIEAYKGTCPPERLLKQA